VILDLATTNKKEKIIIEKNSWTTHYEIDHLVMHSTKKKNWRNNLENVYFAFGVVDDEVAGPTNKGAAWSMEKKKLVDVAEKNYTKNI